VLALKNWFDFQVAIPQVFVWSRGRLGCVRGLLWIQFEAVVALQTDDEFML
jgi:hypothetical protein